MTCTSIRYLIQESLDQPLTSELQTARDAHVESCDACRDYAAGMTALSIRMSAAKAELPPEIDLVAALGLKPAAITPLRRQSKWSTWLPFGAMAACLIVSAGIGTFGQQDPKGPAVSVVATPAAEVTDEAEAILVWFDEAADPVEFIP